MDNQQSADLVFASIGEMSVNDPSSLINMLKVSGYNATSSMNQNQLLDLSMKALKDSNKFKTMLSSYLQNKISELQSSASSFVGNEPFLNADGKGAWLGDIFKDTAKTAIPAIVNGGISYGSTKLNQNASKGSEQRAIELERERTKQLQASLDIARTQGSGSSGSVAPKSRPKWVVPVVIGGVVLVLGVVIYFATKKK